MNAENGKTRQPGLSTELNLEPATYTFTSMADPLTSGNVREQDELRVTRHTQVEEEEEITKEEVEEVEEEEVEEVAAMTPSTPTAEVTKERIRVVRKVSTYGKEEFTSLFQNAHVTCDTAELKLIDLLKLDYTYRIYRLTTPINYINEEDKIGCLLFGVNVSPDQESRLITC